MTPKRSPPNRVSPPNKVEDAVLDLSEGETAKLLKLGHLRVGFISCPERLRTSSTLLKDRH